jgi:3-hydroxymyristoyl/3-hydroxydecanoyl-(acyl carrier protein) dehydratase
VSSASLPIPHREPFLFLSRLDATDGEEALFSYDLPRQGDSFSLRMFPSLLMVEAMAQAAAAFHGVQLSEGGDAVEETGVLASVDKVRISGRPRPGDRLTIKVRRKKAFGPMVMLDGEVWVSHRLACSAQIFVRRGAPGQGAAS